MTKRRASAAVLCYILTDLSGLYAWYGPGFRRLTDSLDLRAVRSWSDRASAARAARALNKTLGITARPCAVRLS
jgi:hypothetical protein